MTAAEQQYLLGQSVLKVAAEVDWAKEIELL